MDIKGISEYLDKRFNLNTYLLMVICLQGAATLAIMGLVIVFMLRMAFMGMGLGR